MKKFFVSLVLVASLVVLAAPAFARETRYHPQHNGGCPNCGSQSLPGTDCIPPTEKYGAKGLVVGTPAKNIAKCPDCGYTSEKWW